MLRRLWQGLGGRGEEGIAEGLVERASLVCVGCLVFMVFFGIGESLALLLSLLSSLPPISSRKDVPMFMSDNNEDPYLSNSELEMSNLLASSQGHGTGSSKTLKLISKVPLFIQILSVLFALMVLLIKSDIQVDTQ